MQEKCVFGIDCEKNVSASWGQRMPLTLYHNFQAIISCLTSRSILMLLYAVVLLKVWGFYKKFSKFRHGELAYL